MSAQDGYSRREFLTFAACTAGALSGPGIVAAADGVNPARVRAPFTYTPTPNADIVVERDDIRLYAQDPGRMKAFKDAIKILKDRPATDPTSFEAHAQKHALHCRGGSMAAQQIHFGARFLPWHRAFLYYFEMQLQAAVREPSLTIPYWNWTDQRTIPQPFWDPMLMPVAPMTTRGMSSQAELEANTVRVSTILALPDFETFGGSTQRNPGNVEFGPHGSVHNQVGGPNGWMSNIMYSPRDPLFYAHHANIDRIWFLWLLDPRHRNWTDPTWRAERFEFTDPAGKTQTVSIDEILGWDIRYNEMPRMVTLKARPGGARVFGREGTVSETVTLGAAAPMAVADALAPAAALHIEGVSLPTDAPAMIDVFLESGTAPVGPPDRRGFVGTIGIQAVGEHAHDVNIHLAVPATLRPLLQSQQQIRVRLQPSPAGEGVGGEITFTQFSLEIR